MAFSESSTRALVCVLAVLFVLAMAHSVLGFRMIQNTATGRLTAGSLVTCSDPGGFLHWTTSGTTWFLNTANQGTGKAAAVQASLATWTNVNEAGFVLTYGGVTQDGWATDGRNTLLWAAGNGCTGSCLALTALVVQNGQVIVESDITFNNSVTWTTTGATYDTQTVATHELGHGLGIHHTEVSSFPRPTMYAYYSDAGGRSLESDDRAALHCAWCRYGPSDPTRCNESPHASIVADNPYDLRVDFDASGSYDPDGTIVRYEWDFQEGTAVTTSPYITHWYVEPVNVYPSVRVVDDDGASDVAYTEVILCDDPDPTKCDWGTMD